jgi:hypothetical protein
VESSTEWRVDGDLTSDRISLERTDELVIGPLAGFEVPQPHTLSHVHDAVLSVRVDDACARQSIFQESNPALEQLLIISGIEVVQALAAVRLRGERVSDALDELLAAGADEVVEFFPEEEDSTRRDHSFVHCVSFSAEARDDLGQPGAERVLGDTLPVRGTQVDACHPAFRGGIRHYSSRGTAPASIDGRGTHAEAGSHLTSGICRDPSRVSVPRPRGHSLGIGRQSAMGSRMQIRGVGDPHSP